MTRFFPWHFPDNSPTVNNIPDIFQIPWHFQVFQTSGHPAYKAPLKTLVMMTIIWCNYICCNAIGKKELRPTSMVGYSSSWKFISKRRLSYGITQPPALTPAMQASTRFTYPEDRVDVGGWLYTPIWFTCPQTVTHPSSNHLIATRPGAEPLDRKLRVSRKLFSL